MFNRLLWNMVLVKSLLSAEYLLQQSVFTDRWIPPGIKKMVIFIVCLSKDFKFNYIIVFTIQLLLIQTVAYQTNAEVKGNMLAAFDSLIERRKFTLTIESSQTGVVTTKVKRPLFLIFHWLRNLLVSCCVNMFNL